MNLHFEPTGGMAPFTMKVGSFDTIQEIKEKIQKDHNIPAQKQTLIFNNQILSDDLNIHPCVDNSHVQLIIAGDQESTPATAPPPEKPSMENINPFDNTFLEDAYVPFNIAPPENQESAPPPAMVTPAATTSSESGSSMKNIDPFESWVIERDMSGYIATPATAPAPAPPPLPPSKKITLILKIPPIALNRIPREFDINDSVRRLKETINEVDKELPVEKIIVRSKGVELHDHNTLHECGLLNYSEIEVSLKRTSKATSSSKARKNNNNKPKNPKIPMTQKKMKIWVVTMCRTKTIPMEVNACDKVEELRKELEPLNLSQEEFFFIYKHNVMEEDKSFEWHNVKQGDNIEIFPKAPKKMKILVVTMYGKKTIPLEVNAWDKVEELRKELDKVNQREPLNLSQEGFFFIHGQAVMDEDKSFEWHNIQEGDKIDIFNGTITKESRSSS